MARSIAGLFPNREQAEAAIRDLKDAGFDAARIGVVMKDKHDTQEIADEHGTHSTEGAVAGGIIGGSVGALLAAAGALVIPGIGPFISGGILATSLVGGAAGWLVGGLAGLGIPREEAEYYEGQVQQGRALVTVDAQSRDAEARSIMLRNGAEDLQERGFGGGYDTPDTTIERDTTTTAAVPLATTSTSSEGDIRVPVMEEELVAGKRMQETGQVHIHKDVIEEQQTVNVPLQRETVHVERVPISGNATMADTTDAFVDRDIDIPLRGEEVVVDKRARAVEEVRIRKDQVTENEQVTDTVRKERVIVDGADETAAGADRESAAVDSRGTGDTFGDRAGGALRTAADDVKGAAQKAGDALTDTPRTY